MIQTTKLVARLFKLTLISRTQRVVLHGFSELSRAGLWRVIFSLDGDEVRVQPRHCRNQEVTQGQEGNVAVAKVACLVSKVGISVNIYAHEWMICESHTWESKLPDQLVDCIVLFRNTS